MKKLSLFVGVCLAMLACNKASQSADASTSGAVEAADLATDVSAVDVPAQATVDAAPMAADVSLSVDASPAG